MTTTTIDPAAIAPALRHAERLGSLMSTVNVATSTMSMETLEREASRLGGTIFGPALGEFVAAKNKLQYVVGGQWRAATKEAQDMAFGFINAALDTELPGMLSLRKECAGTLTVKVESVQSFHMDEAGNWSAGLYVETSPRCHTTERLVVRKGHAPYWEADSLY